jgi:hypothetical protein
MHSLIEHKAPPEILAAATGGTWAAYRSGEPYSADLMKAASDAARDLLLSQTDDSLQALASSSLALMADACMTYNPSADLALAAVSAWRVEHHDVAAWAARQALTRSDQLTGGEIEMVLDVLARIAYGAEAEAELEMWRSRLADRGTVGKRAEHVLKRAEVTPRVAAAVRAINRGDRRRAATLLAEEIEGIDPIEAGQNLIEGTIRAFRAMACDPVPAPELREAMQLILEHLRHRQRFGQPSPLAMFGVSMTVGLITSSTTPETVNVLTELVEALADAGLSDIAELPEPTHHGAILQARLRREAQAFPLWPDLRACVDGLQGRPALLCRFTGQNLSSEPELLCIYIEPPDGVAIKHMNLPRSDAAVLGAFATAKPDVVDAISNIDLDGLVDRLLPAALKNRLQAVGSRDLVIVPDGLLWSVPWHCATLFRDHNVLLAPSLSVYARLDPGPARITTVTAIVDDAIPEAEIVMDALLAARASGALDIQFAERPPSLERRRDCLIVYGHGAGTGLGFGVGTDDARLEALDLATTTCARTAIVAACWSSGRPPISLPVNLPAAMLLGGFEAVVGGLWPLPTAGTARTLAVIIEELGAHGNLADAVAAARARGGEVRSDHWGLAVHGKTSTGRR